MHANEMKKIVKAKYAEIADAGNGCCGTDTGCCDGPAGVYFADSYEHLDGYVPGADLGLGCGLPTEHAGLETGQTVLDLGSGAGNDVFVARALVGPTGRVIGVDMVPEMIAKAEHNARQLGHDNVEFHLGEIEDLPLAAGSVDVVVSNCVLNLVPDKARAFAEIHRVLKPDGHFCISDVVLQGELPPELAEAAVLYAGCVAGAQQRDTYLATIAGAGFRDVEVKKSRELRIPAELVARFLNAEQAAAFASSGIGVFSITVVGRR